MALDLQNPEVQQALQEAGYIAQTDAERMIEEKNAALEANRNDILNQLKETKEKYQGVDLEVWNKLRSDENRFSKLATGGYDAYEKGLGGELEERLNAARSDKMLIEQRLQQEQSQAKQQQEALQEKLKHEKLLRQLNMELAQTEDFQRLAQSDVERDALESLDFDQNGKVVVIGADGVARQTADGAMGIREWLQEMRQERPYRFIGAMGADRSTGDYTQEELDSMSPQQKRALGRKQNRR